MSENEKAKGCMGCLSVGCFAYIVLCIISGIYYYFCNNAMEETKASTFKGIFKPLMETEHGMPPGWDTFLSKVESQGVKTNVKLSEALKKHSIVSNVKTEEYDFGKGISKVIVSMQINGRRESGQSVPVQANMVFMVMTKSLLDRQLAKLLYMDGVVFYCNGYEIPLPMSGGTAKQTEDCYRFVGDLFTGDDFDLRMFINELVNKTQKQQDEKKITARE